MEGQVLNKTEDINNKLSQETTNNSVLKEYLFHPTSIALLVVLDWGGAFIEIPSTLAPFLLFLTASSIFLIAFLLTYNIQKNLAGDDSSKARNKALIAGFICAVPYPIMSSALGLIILGLSGVNAIQNLGPEGILEMFKKRNSKS